MKKIIAGALIAGCAGVCCGGYLTRMGCSLSFTVICGALISILWGGTTIIIMREMEYHD